MINIKQFLMKCGHLSQTFTSEGKPCCIICNCDEKETKKPKLAGRMARCCDCGRLEPSCDTLPFFQSQPNNKQDSFYCGCRGWD